MSSMGRKRFAVLVVLGLLAYLAAGIVVVLLVSSPPTGHAVSHYLAAATIVVIGVISGAAIMRARRPLSQ
jgi:hypothetical protein